MRPPREPRKASPKQRHADRRAVEDERFSKLVTAIRQLATEMIVPSTMLKDAADVVYREVRRREYQARQHRAFILEQREQEQPHEDPRTDGFGTE